MNPLLVDLLTKRIPAFAAEKSASKEADMADAYESLKNNIALYQSTKDSSPEDYNYAGKKVAESLNRFGITQPNGKPLEWSADDTSDKRIQTIEHAIKNFEKGSFTGRDFFDRINYAVKGEYTPTTLDPEVMKGLLSGQAAGQSKSAAGYLAALGSDSETPAGAGQRMVATGQISPKYVNDPQWMAENAAGLLDIAKNGGGDISNDAIKAQMAQNLPPSYTLSTKSSEPGLIAYANQQALENRKIDEKNRGGSDDFTKTMNNYAGAHFGKTYDQLPMEQKQIVLRKVEESATRVAGAKREQNIEIDKSKPISATDLMRYYDPTNGKRVKAGTTYGQAEKAGLIVASDDQLKELNSMSTVKAVVDQLSGLSKKLNTATTAAGGASSGAVNWAGAKLGFNDAARLYDDTKTAWIGNISRTIAAEKGVLTDYDIARVAKALPGFTDKQSVSDAKYALIKNLMQVAEDEAKKRVLGIAPDSTSRDRIDSILDKLDGGKGSSKPTPKNDDMSRFFK